MSVLLAFLAPMLAGCAIVSAVLRVPEASRAGRILVAVTALALGAALVSTGHAAILGVGGIPAARSTAKDLAFATVAAVSLLAHYRARRSSGMPALLGGPHAARPPLAALVGVAVACAAAVFVIVVRSRAMPDEPTRHLLSSNVRSRMTQRTLRLS